MWGSHDLALNSSDHVVCCDRRVGEADPVAQSAAATAAVEHSKSQNEIGGAAARIRARPSRAPATAGKEATR